MGVTHVIRGEDHISNTPRQILLYEALGFTPPSFAHLALVMGPDHSPLSKRHGATSVAEFRAQGLPAGGAGQLPRADRLVARCERATELLPIDELARRFSLDAVGHSAGVFDEEKLAWVNRHYLKMADPRAARRAVGAVSSAAPASTCRPTRAASSFWRRRCRSRPRRSIGSTRCRRGSRFCSTYDRREPRWRDAARARGDEHATGARRGCARWPRSWRARRGSIASGSARWRTR